MRIPVTPCLTFSTALWTVSASALMFSALACRSQERAVEPATDSPTVLASGGRRKKQPRNEPKSPIAPSSDSAPAVSEPLPASPTASRIAYRIAALGDSLTDPRSHGGGYLDYVKKRCPETQIENFAVGGYMVNQIRKRFEKRVLQRPPGSFSHIVVWGGVNDLYSDKTAFRTVSKIEADLSAIYEKARAHGSKVIAISVSPWGGFSRYYTEHRGQNTLKLNAWILEDNPLIDVAIDAYSLLSCGVPDHLCRSYQPLYRDGLHLGKVGHERVGKALYEAAFSDCR